MSAARAIVIDRIALTLDGVAADDARLLAGGLGAAIEARLALGGGGADEDGGEAMRRQGPLVTALRGQALVDAVASRLVAAMAAGSAAAPATTPEEDRPWR